MEISDQLLCLFFGQVEQRNESYVVEVPEQELRLGAIQEGDTCRIAILSGGTETDGEAEDKETKQEQESPEPPVEEGDRREVEIEAIGDQGDGIARVERGFVVIVPDTEKGERVIVEINEVRQNVAFAEVVDRQTHF